jgi:carboxyl-terminal processing protease
VEPAVSLSPRTRLLSLLTAPLLACALMALAGARPATAQTGTVSATTIRAAYDRLLNSYVDPLRPDEVLFDAWNGAVAAAIAAGVDEVPSLSVLPEDRDLAWLAFADAFAELERLSAGRITAVRLADAALRAMTEGRNECHTYYLTPQQYRRRLDEQSGNAQYVGIGVAVTNGPPFIISIVYPDSPAARAGLMMDDEIVAVNGIPAAEQTRESLGDLIRGEEGTPVTLTIRRGAAAPVDVVIVRGLVRIPVLTTAVRPDGVGVLTLYSFTSDGSSERLLREALHEFDAQGVRAWVLDLRFNPGGDARSVHSVLGIFLPEQTLGTVWVTRTGERRFTSTGEPAAVQRPLAILIGAGSASGAEIVAAVLQDTGRARIFGQRSAGCANVATVYRLPGDAGIAVTTGRVYVGPRQRVVDGIGVTPDEVTASGPGDPTLQAAVGYLLGRVPAAAAP